MEWLNRWWQEATVGGGAVLTIARWWFSRRSPMPSGPSGPSAPPARTRNPLRQFLQWIDFAKRLEIQNAAEQQNQAINQRIDAYAKELVIDLDFCQTQNSKLRAKVRELEAERDASSDFVTGSTATPGRKIRPRNPRVPRSVKPKRLKTRS